jgi:hypothetical protein
VLVEQGSDPFGVGEHTGDVRCGGEAPDEQRPVGVLGEPFGQLNEVDVAVGVLVDDDDVGDGLPPRQLVGVVLVGTQEHHRTFVHGDLLAQPVALVEARGNPELEDAHELVDRRGGARPAEDHHVVLSAPDGVVDEPPGILPQLRGLQPGAGALGVGVGVPREHLVAEEVLQEVQ